ncbi:MAG: hypothetical protein WC076_04095 [Terrimicrobiaceae bacterium]|jgi:hypothetical protein
MCSPEFERCGRKKAKNGWLARCKPLIINMRDFQKKPFCARILKGGGYLRAERQRSVGGPLLFSGFSRQAAAFGQNSKVSINDKKILDFLHHLTTNGRNLQDTRVAGVWESRRLEIGGVFFAIKRKTGFQTEFTRWQDSQGENCSEKQRDHLRQTSMTFS